LIADDHPVARSGIKGLLAGAEIKIVFRKIGLTDRTQAAVWAVRKGLV
jgi:DNA-binding NarL/FixJ family response regulator